MMCYKSKEQYPAYHFLEETNAALRFFTNSLKEIQAKPNPDPYEIYYLLRWTWKVMGYNDDSLDKIIQKPERRIMEDIDKYFMDWENHVFGFGYGTGEEYTLKALKDFMEGMENGESSISYDFEEIYKKLGAMCAWLMINILNHASILEYGTSPRFGWLTGKGKKLYAYLKTKTVDDLYNLTTSKEEGTYCYPDHCNCEELGQEKCNNPFF